MRTYKCKDCSHTAEGNGPGCLIGHARDAHGKSNRGPRRENARRRRAAKTPAVDAETSLLTQCTDLFIHAGTDTDADRRVLEYLATRFGPAAYEDASVDEEPAAE